MHTGTPKKLFLSGLLYALDNHKGTLRMVHGTGETFVYTGTGNSYSHMPIDGRAYHAFVCDGHDARYQRTETGSVETNDLIIEWRKA